MKIIDVKWTKKFNILIVKCHVCNTEFEHRADRWNARCTYCHTQERLDVIRDRYMEGVE